MSRRIPNQPDYDDEPPERKLKLTPASEIAPRPVKWLWAGRIPLGSFSLLGGREGVGKSTVAYELAGDITRGHMPGEFYGQARAVIVAATEDSWEHTIVPRLMAAKADLSMVYRVDVVTELGVDTALTLPTDLIALEDSVREVGAALVLLDPLLSRLSTVLDSHKDAEVRTALEPLVSLADRCGVAVVGLIHVNKSAGSDPLTLLMASRAFVAVARSVLFAMLDADDQEVRYLGHVKSNLGPMTATIRFAVAGELVAETPEGPVWTSKVIWAGEVSTTIHELIAATAEGADLRTATGEAQAWLEDYLKGASGVSASAKIKEEGQRAGHSRSALDRAKQRLRVTIESEGFPRVTFWRLPSVASLPLETSATEATEVTVRGGGLLEQQQTPLDNSCFSGVSRVSCTDPPESETTGNGVEHLADGVISLTESDFGLGDEVLFGGCQHPVEWRLGDQCRSCGRTVNA